MRLRLGLVTLLLGSLASLWAFHYGDPGGQETGRAFDPARLGPGAGPRPTEGGGKHDEKKSQVGRRDWVRQMHRSHADWRVMERENGLAEVARHRAMAMAPPDTFGGAWLERGSNNQAGRMHVTKYSTDRTQLYAGSAFGGLWRGTPEGTDWTPLGDATYGGVHFLEVVPGADTGDPDVLITATDGGIVLRSGDAGVTWQAATDIGSPWWARRLMQSSDGSHTLFLVTASTAGNSLFRSVDKGLTWQDVYDFNGYYGDVWAPRDGGETLYLLEERAVLTSVDSGDTWVTVGELPRSNQGDITGSEAGGPTIYCVLDNAELYRSDNGGADWLELGALGDYWGGSLNASMVDSAMFVYGGVELHKSFDGGATFQTQNAWSAYYGDPENLLHADIDGIDVIPDGLGGETWFVDTDGGVYRSVDDLDSVQNLSMAGLRVGQYYDVLTSKTDPTHIAIGAQDQGYQLTNDVAQDDDVLEADQVMSGDYGHLTSGDGTHDWVFSVYPGFVLAQHGETDPSYSYVDFPGGETYVPWLPPIAADPEEPSAFFFPASHIYRYTHTGGSRWEITQWSDQDFSLRRDEYVSRLEFSPVNPNRAYAATSYGRVWWSDDHAVTWTMSASIVPDDNWYYGQAVAPSLTDEDTVTVGGSGYGVPAVYRSTDGGRTFAPWSEGLPDTLVYTLVEAPDGSGTVFAGTETAAWRRGADDGAWVNITSAAAPITTYWDAEGLTAENTIRFATYGRGVWDYQIDPTGAGCYPPHDGDGDGVNCDLDCNDLDPARFPGAVEVCGDGIDQDCDGVDPTCTGAKACGCATGDGGVTGWALLVALVLSGGRRRYNPSRAARIVSADALSGR